MYKRQLLTLAVSVAVAGTAIADKGDTNHQGKDFGLKVQQMLNSQSNKLFGIQKPLQSSADTNISREPGQDAYDLIKLASGLEARILTRQAGNKADMFAFWPDDENPTHTIWCIEGGVESLGATLPGDGEVEKLNPSVQAVDMDGKVSTLLRGMDRCDGIRRTAWGTVLVTEETGDGQAYEIINPLDIENETVTGRTTGEIVTVDGEISANIVKRDSLPTMSWEGLTVLDQGVVIGGDELRPGTGVADSDGGAIFKFVPAAPYDGPSWINDLADSPLVDGTVHAFRADCREGTSGSFPQYGQGCEIGNGSWIQVSAATARDDADAYGATGYYRPEDLHADPTYDGEGVRFCWTNTGREAAYNYGEVICGIDYKPMTASDSEATIVVNRFVEGDADFNSVDNLAFQPHTGMLYVIEDHDFGDVFACLPDGGDRDIKTDGCVKVLSVRDEDAEPTGFEFFGSGRAALVSIQHSPDGGCDEGTDCAEYDGYPTDDIVIITGFRVRK